jgi:hypothetical protein
LVGSVAVEVAGVIVEDLLGVAAVEEQDPVGALLPYGAYEPFRCTGCSWGCAGGSGPRGDALAGEDGVERGGELPVPVPDEMGELSGKVVELPEKLAGLLCGPRGGGVGSAPRMCTVRVCTSMTNRA